MRKGFLVIGLVLLSGCSTEQWNRTAFAALHEQQRWQCLQEGRTDCPSASSFNDYHRERDSVINSGSTTSP